MHTLKDAIEAAGGVSSVASGIHITERAIYKWLTKGRLPRSEYTGESLYSQKIAELSKGKFTKEQILKAGNPTHTKT